ncbi:protein of unknown function [Pararobbsia alpina]
MSNNFHGFLRARHGPPSVGSTGHFTGLAAIIAKTALPADFRTLPRDVKPPLRAPSRSVHARHRTLANVILSPQHRRSPPWVPTFLGAKNGI